MPPTIGAAIRLVTLAPAPLAQRIGTRPRVVVPTVMSFGRGKGWTGGSGGAVMVRGPAEVNLDWLGSPGGFGLGGEIGILARAEDVEVAETDALDAVRALEDVGVDLVGELGGGVRREEGSGPEVIFGQRTHR